MREGEGSGATAAGYNRLFKTHLLFYVSLSFLFFKAEVKAHNDGKDWMGGWMKGRRRGGEGRNERREEREGNNGRGRG